MKDFFIKNTFNADNITSLSGWIKSKRAGKQVLFFDLSDSTGSIQLVFDKEVLGEKLFDKAKKVTIESAIEVSGKIQIIENDIQQGKCAFVICGDDMKQFWTWDKIIRKKEKQPQLLFILPDLIGLDGNPISPKSNNNTLCVKFDLNDRTTGFTNINAFSNIIKNATSKEALLQIYTFFIFLLIEMNEQKAKDNVFFKVRKQDNSYCDIKTVSDISASLSNVNICDLKQDLEQRVKNLFNRLSNILIKK